MFWKKKSKGAKEFKNIDVNIDEIRQAITKMASDLPLNVSLRTFVNEDYSLDYNLLKSVLKGIPNQTYYMSKETFEVFDNPEMARTMDEVQIAVDQYYQEKGELPIIPGDHNCKISYFLMKDYLRSQPDFPLYVHREDHLITYQRPKEFL